MKKSMNALGTTAPLFAPLIAAIALGQGALASPTQELATVSGAGGWVTNGTMRMVFCAGCLGGPTSRGAAHVNYSGFVGASFIQPGTVNANGIPIEADPDNDGDGLADADEVTGAAFEGHATTDPNKADTDGDGMRDDAEARGMYDPTDPGHLLRITAFETGNGTHTLTWIGRAGLNRIYHGSELLDGSPTQLLHEATFSGGAPPWHKTTNNYTWSSNTDSKAVFGVRTVQ